MGNFRQNNFSRRNNDRRDNRDFGRRDRQMFEIKCDKCGKNAQVPFKPTQGKQVLCSECFEKDGGRQSHGQGNNNAQLEQINAKLDKIIAILSDLEVVNDDDLEDEEENN